MSAAVASFLLAASITSTVGAQSTAARPAAAGKPRETAACTWVKRLLADAPKEFKSFQGGPGWKKLEHVFDGTLKPQDDVEECQLFERWTSGEKTAAPYYTCTYSRQLAWDEAVRRKNELAGELRACLPGWEFVDKQAGELKKKWHYDSANATKDGLRVSVSAFNKQMLAASMAGVPLEQYNEPKTDLSITVALTK
jgi:hypothetical protein